MTTPAVAIWTRRRAVGSSSWKRSTAQERAVTDKQTRDLKARLGTKAEEFYPWLHELLSVFVH